MERHPQRYTRRALLARLIGLGLVIGVGSACVQREAPAPTGQPPAPTSPPAATTAPKPAAAAQPTQAAPAQAKPALVRIGALWPLTGPQAQDALLNVRAKELARDIVNDKYNLPLPLAPEEGLPNLGGAKIEIVVADHQSSPEKALAEAERLITQEKVIALCAGYASSTTATASQAAERLGIPYLAGAPSSPTLTARGFKWFFRTGPHDIMFTQAQFDFLKDLNEKKGAGLKTVGLLYEDTLFGADSAKTQREFAAKYGFEVVADIQYKARATSLTTEVQKLKAANPDVLLPTSYTNDAILLHRTMKELGYKPKLVLAQDAGHLDPAYIEQLGKDAEGTLSRSGFDYDLGKKRPVVAEVQRMFKERVGRDINETAAKSFTGFLTLADAINRAGSTDPEKIRQAILETEIPAERTIMPWRGIKFNPQTGQNDWATGVVVQLQDGAYRTVWPFEQAAAELRMP